VGRCPVRTHVKTASGARAIASNPVRDAAGSASSRTVSPGAPTVEQAQALQAALRDDDRAIRRVVVDLADFLLCIGPHTGEAVAVLWDALDLDEGTVEVRGTRGPDQGRRSGHQAGTEDQGRLPCPATAPLESRHACLYVGRKARVTGRRDGARSSRLRRRRNVIDG
jgi:hypothetical protein